MAGRQRSMKHRSGAPGQGGFSRQPPLSPSPPPFPIFEMPYGNLIPAVMDPSMVGPRPAVGGVVHLRPNYSSPNNLPRRESSGARPHGDWTYNQGNRHNHGRRDPPYQFAPRHGGFIPSPPPSSPPFLPQAVGSMGYPIGFGVYLLRDLLVFCYFGLRCVLLMLFYPFRCGNPFYVLHPNIAGHASTTTINDISYRYQFVYFAT